MSTSSSSPVSASSHDDAVANWWEYGSVPLVKRCIREYGWSDKYAARVLGGYKKFLQLKKDLSDWDHKILSPSIPVDKMWHMHILDVANYIKDCELLCGHLVGHDPDGMLNADARKRRVETTKHILQNQLGGEMDEEVWNFGSGMDSSSTEGGEDKEGSDDESPSRKRRWMKEDTTDDDDDDGHCGGSKGNGVGDDDCSSDWKRRREDENTGPDGSSGSDRQQAEHVGETITIIIRDGNGAETHFKVSPSTKIRKIFKAYADRKGIDIETFRFLVDFSERISPYSTQTVQMLELEDGDVIVAMLEQTGC